MQSISWCSVDLLSGRRGPPLVTSVMGSMGRSIGEATELTGLPVLCWYGDTGTPVPGWDPATLPGRTMAVAVDDDTDQPVWGGMVQRRRSTKGAWVQLDLATLEAYFDRRYVTDHVYTATAQGAIIAGVLAADVIPTGVQLILDAQSATVRDRTYVDDEDKNATEILQELAGVEGGPEFTVDLEWADEDHMLLNRVVRVRDRIGTAAVRPVSRFELPGSVNDFEYVEDYTTENGANDVLATSSGEGDVRPESAHQVATDLLAGGWARFENRFTPSTSITDVATLNAHALAELTEMRDGLAQFTLELALETAPRVGVDFHLGDDVMLVLTCPRFPERIGPDGEPVPGYEKSVRCLGYEVDYDGGTVKPVLRDVG